MIKAHEGRYRQRGFSRTRCARLAAGRWLFLLCRACMPSGCTSGAMWLPGVRNDHLLADGLQLLPPLGPPAKSRFTLAPSSSTLFYRSWYGWWVISGEPLKSGDDRHLYQGRHARRHQLGQGQASPHAGRRRRGGRRGQGGFGPFTGGCGRQDWLQRRWLPKRVRRCPRPSGIPGRIILKENRSCPLMTQCAQTPRPWPEKARV